MRARSTRTFARRGSRIAPTARRRLGRGRRGRDSDRARGRARGAPLDARLLGAGDPRAEQNLRYVERLLKFLLWQKGGWKVSIAGPRGLVDASPRGTLRRGRAPSTPTSFAGSTSGPRSSSRGRRKRSYRALREQLDRRSAGTLPGAASGSTRAAAIARSRRSSTGKKSFRARSSGLPKSRVTPSITFRASTTRSAAPPSTCLESTPSA